MRSQACCQLCDVSGVVGQQECQAPDGPARLGGGRCSRGGPSRPPRSGWSTRRARRRRGRRWGWWATSAGPRRRRCGPWPCRRWAVALGVDELRQLDAGGLLLHLLEGGQRRVVLLSADLEEEQGQPGGGLGVVPGDQVAEGPLGLLGLAEVVEQGARLTAGRRRSRGRRRRAARRAARRPPCCRVGRPRWCRAG